jgi:hypothetical protein
MDCIGIAKGKFELPHRLQRLVVTEEIAMTKKDYRVLFSMT